MEIFNIKFIKEIINIYFNNEYISNYIYYDDSFYIILSKILNEMLQYPQYNNNYYIFFENLKMININNLLDKYDNLLEYQIILAFLYEILLITQTVDYYNIKVDDILLFELLETDQKFSFMSNIVKEIKNEMDIDLITNQFNNI